MRFLRSKTPTDAAEQAADVQADLSPAQQQRILQIARRAVHASIQEADAPPPADLAVDWPDLTPRGAFVTLRVAGRLRGCIGTFAPSGPFPDTVWLMAAAAARDPRFIHFPLEPPDLPHLRIEISALSPLEQAGDPLSLVIGRHGIYIATPLGHGCFLPEVATDFGWTAEQFLARCCVEKIGLAADAWTRPDAEVFLFTVSKMEEPV